MFLWVYSNIVVYKIQKQVYGDFFELNFIFR